MIQPITVHVFCAVYIPSITPPSGDDGASVSGYGSPPKTACDYGSGSSSLVCPLECFRHYDATERQGASHLTEYVPYTDETRYRSRWLRGPFSPPQGNLDHLLKPGSKIPPDLLEQQNALYRAHPI